MDPTKYLDNVAKQLEAAINDKVINNNKQIERLVLLTQAKVLGFNTNDHSSQKISGVTDEFIKNLEEFHPDVMEKMKETITKTVAHELELLNRIELPRTVIEGFKLIVEKITKNEIDKIKPQITAIIKSNIEKELLNPWLAVAKMRDLETVEEGLNQDIPF